MAEIAGECVQPAHYTGNIDKLVDMIVAEAKPTDHILVMSNGSFGGIHQKIIDRLKIISMQSAVKNENVFDRTFYH